MASGGTGELQISADCVSVVLPTGDIVLPVWHRYLVTWVEAEQGIKFAGRDEELMIRDGDRVGLGGEALSDEDPEVRSEVPWVNEPSANCPGEPFIVDLIEVHAKK